MALPIRLGVLGTTGHRIKRGAVRRYRAVGRHAIGLVVNLEPKYPHSRDPRDLQATRRADAYLNRQYLDPAILGHYPAEMAEIFGDAWTEPPQRDAETLNEPLRQAYLRGHIEAVRKAPSSTGRLSPATAAALRQAERRYAPVATADACPTAGSDGLSQPLSARACLTTAHCHPPRWAARCPLPPKSCCRRCKLSMPATANISTGSTNFQFDVKSATGKIVPGLGWFANDYIGIDQGPILLMAENYRSELIWNVMKTNPYIRAGLQRAGFRGGWLNE